MSQLPNLIIAGVNKAATTSLYTYLARHPDICGSSVKETNYFMPIAFGEPLAPIETYAGYFDSCNQRRYRMEASPRYIFGGLKLAQSIRDRLGPIRIVFVLRQPIDRLRSYFDHMKTSAELPPDTRCDDYARRALEELPAVKARTSGAPVNVYGESIFIRGLAQGFYADYLGEWYSVFADSIRVYFFEDLTRDPGAVMRDLCAWLGLNAAVYEHVEFSWENRTMKHKNQMLARIAERINDRYEPFWRRHGRIKQVVRDLYSWLNEARSGGERLSPDRRAELGQVYRPYNQRLLKMLREKGYRDLPEWLARSSSS
ncbi:MAG: sulfotransferase domain-containing protein [Deltaproteobacteria bacterium]|nr:sulfotransferase domain-containing protein [Deltaproteobacteria bacterium]